MCLLDSRGVVMPVRTEVVGRVAKPMLCSLDVQGLRSADGLLGSPIFVVSGELGQFGEALFVKVQFPRHFVV